MADGVLSRRHRKRPRAFARAVRILVPALLLLFSAVALGSGAKSSATGDFRCRGAIATIVGTAGDDRIVGTRHGDVIVARAGNDVVRARGGDDKICDNDGTDHVIGGAGDDEVGGGSGNDQVEGGSGDDWLAGRRGNDRIAGGSGRDRVVGELGNDKLQGNAGADNLGGGPGTDDCLGGAGRDKVRACETGDGRADRPPVAADDVDATSEIAAKDVGVLANDSDPDGDPFSVGALDTSGTRGQVTISGGGVRYDPNGRFNALAVGENATDQFRYQLSGSSGFATVTMTVTGADTSPTAVDDTRTVDEDDPAQMVDVLGNDTDPDGGAGKSIDSLTQPANGTVAITGGGSSLTYQPDADYCNQPSLGPTDNFSYTIAPGGSVAQVAVRVSCINDAPVLSTTGSALDYDEGDGQAAVDDGLSVTDIDSANLSGATVAITSNFASAEDELAFTDQFGITGTYDSGTGVLTLSGTTSVANYQTALRSVTYENQSDTPSTATRTLSFQGTDSSSAPTTVETRDIAVTQTNDAPTVTTTGGNTAYTEGAAAATVDNGLTVTDPDDTNIEGATVRLSPGFQAGDDLVFVNQNGISGVYDTGTGVLTLTGTASVADYQTALRSIQFRTTNDNPASSKTVDFVANDGDANGSAGTKGIAVTGVNDAPTLTTTGSALAYGENAGPVAVDAGLTATDPDSANLSGATVQITSNFASAEDDLAFTDQLGITGSYNDTTGTLTLSGTASVANYQAALRAVTYENSSNNPSTATRTVSFQGTDASGDASSTATRNITVGPANDAPVVTTSGGALSYTEGGPSTAIDSALTVSDADDTNLEGGQVRISAGFQSGDDLVFVNQNGISGVYNTGTGVLTLTGTATVADYQTALRSIQFQTTNDNPSTPKTVEFKLNDGDSDSNAATRNIAITPANDAPTLNTTGSALSYSEGDGAVPVDAGLTASDPDSANLSGATVQITSNFASAEDDLAFTDQLGITGSYNDTTGTLTLSGTASVANYQAALRAVTYENSSDTPSTATRTVTLQATDAAGAPSNTPTRDISVSPTNDAPVVTTSAGDTAYTEGDPATTIDSGLTVTDVDDTNLEGGQVRISSGFQAGDDLVFVNQNGISGVYNTGTGVLTLTGTASKADYQTALRSIQFQTTNDNPSATKTVEFKVNDGDADSNAATKSISVTPLNSPPAIGTGGTLNYTENDPATAVDSALTVTEPESDDITGASASVTSNFQSGEDALAWADNNGADGITLDGTSTAQTIVLTGTDTAANYQAALRAVTYANSSESPSTLSRTVTFSATDELIATGTGTRTIAVTSVDDPPTAVNDSETVLEDAAATSIPVLTNDTDVDAGPKTISSATDPANGTVVLTGGSPGAHTGLTYQPDPNYCNDAPLVSEDTFDYTLNGGSSATVSMTVTCVNDAPVADDETFNGNDSAHGNTTLQVDDPDDNKSAPTHPHTEITGDILAGDTDVDGPGPLAVTPGTFATNDGGSVTVESDGDFTFHPAASTSCADTSDFFDYTVEDSGSPEQTDTGRVTIAIAGCVWYVSNNAAGNSGTSSAPFDTLAQAETASGDNHTVFVFDGDDTSTGYASGFAMNSGERLIGEHEGLVVDPDQGGALTPDTLHPANAGAHPSLTATSEDVVALDDGNEVRGFNVDPNNAGGITGGAGDTGGGTIDDVNIVDAGTAGTQPGLELNGTTGTFNVSDFTYDNTGVPSTAAAASLVNAGTVGFGAGDPGDPTSITKVGGPALNALSTSMGTSTFDTIIVTGSGNGGIDLTNTTGTTTFGDGTANDVALTTTSGATPAFRLNSAGTASVPVAGTSNVSATGGPAVDITGTTPGAGGFSFDDLDSTNSASDGINLSGLGAGSFSANSASTIAGATGISFDLDGGNGSITFPGTFNNGSGQTAEITGRTGGAVSFDGPVNDTNDAGGGISLSANSGGSTTFSNAIQTIDTTTSGSPAQNNAITMLASDGHTLNLTGGSLDIDSSGRGLQADTSGVLTVAGSNNTINSVSGTALEVSNTDIGAADLSFQRIDAGNATAAADPANGIVLSNTGSAGELTVSGTGGTCTNADTSGCSGGRIRSTAGADSSSAAPAGTGIVLNNTRAPSFTRMHIHDHPNYGIRGNQVTGLTVADSVVNGTNGTNGLSPFEDGSAKFTDLFGTVSVTGSDISGGVNGNLVVDNNGSGALDATVNGVDFGSIGAGPDDSVRFNGVANTATTMDVTVTGSTFTSAVGDIFQWVADGTGGGDLVFTNNDVSNNNPAIANGGGGVTLTGGARAVATLNVSNNTFRDSHTSALTINKSRDDTAGAGSLTGTVDSNTIGVVADANSGSLDGAGIEATHFGESNYNLTFTNNAIHQYNSFGMSFISGGGIAETGNFNLNISGNTISTPGTNPNVTLFQGIGVNSGVAAGDSFQTCVNFGANSIAGSGSDTITDSDFRMRARQNTTIRLPGYAGGPTDGVAAATFAESRIGGGAQGTAAALDSGTFTGTGATCP